MWGKVQEILQCLKKEIKWVAIAVVAILLALVFVFSLPGILKEVNKLECLQKTTYFWISDDIKDWFSFWGSFSGAFVSIIMTIITLRLTMKIEESNKRNTTLQNLSTLIMNIPYMYCTKANLASLSRGDVLENYRDTDSYKEEYTFYFEMDAKIPTYFEVMLEDMEIILPHKEKGKYIQSKYNLHKEQYRILSGDKFSFFINIVECTNKTLNSLYCMDLLKSIANDSVCVINIGVKLINELYIENDKVENRPIKLNIGLQVQNVGTSKGNKGNDGTRFQYKDFSIIRTQMKRIR